LLFDGEAERFYRIYVANTVQTLNEAYARLLEVYNSATRQTRAKKEFSHLRVLEVAQKEKVSIHAALERVRNEITIKAPQGPPTHRDKYHKIDFSHDAVIGLPWAKEPLGRCQSAKVPWTIAELYEALYAAYLQEQEEKDARRHDQACYRGSTIGDLPNIPGVAGINFTDQGLNGRARTPGSRSSKPSDYQNRIGPRRCFTCDSPDHLIRDCTEPKRTMQTVASKVAKLNNARDVKRVLYDNVCQMEGALFNKGDDEDPEFKSFFHTNTENDSSPSNDTPDIEIPVDVFYQKTAAARESDSSSSDGLACDF
jgi:Zinc knuckle